MITPWVHGSPGSVAQRASQKEITELARLSKQTPLQFKGNSTAHHVTDNRQSARTISRVHQGLSLKRNRLHPSRLGPITRKVRAHRPLSSPRGSSEIWPLVPRPGSGIAKAGHLFASRMPVLRPSSLPPVMPKASQSPCGDWLYRLHRRRTPGTGTRGRTRAGAQDDWVTESLHKARRLEFRERYWAIAV